MSALAVFAFGEQMVRISDQAGAPWFVGRDVCAALELKNSRHALGRLPDDEKGVVIGDTLGGAQEIAIISEPGMYRLVLTSRTEKAERFKKWVVSEVLPAIRRTGSFAIAPDAANDAADDEIEGLDFETETGRAAVLTKLALVRVAGRSFGRSAAQEAWRRVGLPDVVAAAAAGFIGLDDADISAWLKDRIELVPASKVQSSLLYADYVGWCRSRHLTVRSIAWFGKRMRQSGINFHKSGAMFAVGVRLRGFEALAA